MKIVILATAMLGVLSLSAEARDVQQGTLMVTGDTNLDIGSSKAGFAGGSIETDSTTINLAGAYFVARNVGVGVMLNSEHNETDDGSTVSKETLSMLGPIVGYNLSLTRASSLLFQGALFLVNGDLDDGAGTKADLDGDGYMVGGSYNYFFNDHVALSVALRYVKADIDMSNGVTGAAGLRETAMSMGFSTFF